ncbi:PREDICTED: NADH dehydrogenase [ubiquinone] 1 beta subcomplex subunit 2, mitochondrial-like [Dinoponera quadriceps]|uniref:NADH dehydrogenase [ubiquinone] 1 beta subcomplex subunit 2, mitochondrial-like n=1 Tax=Dinoponera quadriceps TaxID=609295 RepID=A0A6P3Y8Q5_DINQU|nr:PREDICTED: NADH dehydrogenase [ubiquinone] 1 beta subcomplex subunit 2, mitochondrial-like [Dinoponera quadriceps]XP_014486388.1 PREDICTED: NADH dehydrogenase [ubiquinone] 1 beta subcomplex subunit 2, mitochondrial-like [Dinoponera quadriceps]
MILSRGLNLLKVTYKTSQNKVAATNLQSVRFNSGDDWVYRASPPVEKNWLYVAEAFGGLLWWWILWHFWHDYDHFLEIVPYPNPVKWTDEELGIPPDDYEETQIE